MGTLKARCPFCGKVYEADTQDKLIDLARSHLLTPGPCSDKAMEQITGMVDSEEE